jgi:hypothetical protein
VCSTWRLGSRSRVTTVPWSRSVSTSGRPMLTIGSTASTSPASRRKSPLRVSRLTKLGTCGFSCMTRPMPWPTYCVTTLKPAVSTCRCISAATAHRSRGAVGWGTEANSILSPTAAEQPSRRLTPAATVFVGIAQTKTPAECSRVGERKAGGRGNAGPRPAVAVRTTPAPGGVQECPGGPAPAERGQSYGPRGAVSCAVREGRRWGVAGAVCRAAGRAELRPFVQEARGKVRFSVEKRISGLFQLPGVLPGGRPGVGAGETAGGSGGSRNTLVPRKTKPRRVPPP